MAAAIRSAAFDQNLLRGIEPQDGWQRARVDPVTVVEAAPGVEVDARWRIVAYQWYEDGNGWGAVFAVPTDDADAAPVLHDDGRFELPPHAASSISVALRPSGDLASFFARTLLVRELHEIGALWHEVRWGSHDLMTGSPELPDDQGPWSWELPAPLSFDPVVEMMAAAMVRVVFYTRTDLGGARIVEHVDSQAIRDGSIKSDERVVARGTGGWIP